MERLLENRAVQEALAYIRKDDERTLAEHLELCQIPAPSHEEEKRAEYVMEKFREAGLAEVRMDEVRNVTGVLPGTGDGPTIMLAAHLDTVFPMDTDLTIRREGNRYYCPGINDDTRAVAEVLTIARAMKAADLRLTGDLIFCANVCEEGLGDLKGVRHLFSRGRRIDGFVSIDNPFTGGIIYTATGSHRYQVTFVGRGGHSFSDFGIPNPIHALGRAIAKISAFQVPKEPKTTFNVGMIQGGTSVNTISGSASMLVDLRSDSAEELDRLDRAFQAAVQEALEEENLRWDSQEKLQVHMEPKGNRPAGTQSPDCPIVRTAWKAAELLGIRPELRDESSTDANIPISLGIPAIAVGRGGREDGIHTLHEWFEPVESWLGPQKDLLLLLGLGGLEGCLPAALKKAFEMGASVKL